VKHATVTIILLLVFGVAAGASPEMWASFYDWELQRAKVSALRAMNTPEVWKRFPREQHERHYTPIVRDIAFGFATKRGSGSILTVIIPTTHIGPRHRALVYVTFDQGLKIIHIAEVPQI
jgi:hypothetical protein